MANDLITLSDVLTWNDENMADINPSDLLQRAVLLGQLNAVPSSNGDVHKYLVENHAPVVGFRGVNAGRDHDKSGDRTETTNLKFLDASFHIDIAALAVDKGRQGGQLARESVRHARAAFFKAEGQYIYGTGDDSDGFSGITDVLDALSDDMVVDGGGAAADTQTSVYAIRSMADEGVAAVYANDGSISIEDLGNQQVTDATGKPYTARCVSIGAWMGMQVGSKYDIARLANVGADGDGGLTDAKLSQLLEICPFDPSFFIFSRRSRSQLQRSRTTYNPAGRPADRPADYEGIPLLVSEAVKNTEAVVA